MPDPQVVLPWVSLTNTDGTPNQRQISSIWNRRLASSSMSCGDMLMGSNFMPISSTSKRLSSPVVRPAKFSRMALRWSGFSSLSSDSTPERLPPFW